MATESDLVFPAQANHNFSRILGDLKRAHLSIPNRLRSIRGDAAFVGAASAAFGGRPVVANERCGSWYVEPARKAASAYFKSTDGHAGQWRFSARRLNLHLLPLIGRHDGCVVVDSTRRGKLMPDALSKTVPIWCCVLNRVLFPEGERTTEEGSGGGEGGEGSGEEGRKRGGGKPHPLYTPPNVVSRSEHAQAEARIEEHVAALRALDVDVASLRRHVSKPLRPIWVTPESRLPDPGGDGDDDDNVVAPVIFDDAHPVICCTSSRRVPDDGGAGAADPGYVQGAGDDTENWALGLTPPVFWRHADALLAASEADLPDLIRALVAGREDDAGTGVAATAAAAADVAAIPEVRVAPRLFVSQLPVPSPSRKEEEGKEERGRSSRCTIAFVPHVTDRNAWVKSPVSMEVGIGRHKLASRHLRTALEAVCDFADAYLAAVPGKDEEQEGEQEGRGKGKGEQRQILIACETGKDLSVGVALALACRLFDDDGNYRRGSTSASASASASAPAPDPSLPQVVVNKALIRVRLGRIMMAFPEANPSRATLQSVNSYLMG